MKGYKQGSDLIGFIFKRSFWLWFVRKDWKSTRMWTGRLIGRVLEKSRHEMMEVQTGVLAVHWRQVDKFA